MTEEQQPPQPEPVPAADRKRAIKQAGLAILALELLTRRSLKLATEAVAHTVAAFGADPLLASHAVEEAARRQILAARGLARTASRHAFGKQTGLDANALTRGAAAATDEAAARSAAQGLGHAYRVSAHGLGEAANGIDRVTPKEVAADILPNIRRTATTEVVDAFNDEHRELAREARRRGHSFIHTWHADLDERTCQTCAGMDGTEISDGETFPYGWPPLHPHCRCYVSTRVVEGTGQDEDISAAIAANLFAKKQSAVEREVALQKKLFQKAAAEAAEVEKRAIAEAKRLQEASDAAKRKPKSLSDLPTVKTLPLEEGVPFGRDEPHFDRTIRARTAATTERAKDGVRKFTGAEYTSIRKYERGEIEPGNFRYVAARKASESIARFFEDATPSPATVYRGEIAYADRLHRFMTEDVIQFGGTTSMTRSAEVARDFARIDVDAHTGRMLTSAGDVTGGTSIFIKIEQRSGVAIEHLSSVVSEREFLMPKEAKFRVVSRRVIEPVQGKARALYLEVVEVP